MLFEASNGDPSFIQVMVGEGKASVSQIREMGLLMVTVTSSSALSSVTPRMEGATVIGGQGGAHEQRAQPWVQGPRKASDLRRSAAVLCYLHCTGETEAQRSSGRCGQT